MADCSSILIFISAEAWRSNEADSALRSSRVRALITGVVLEMYFGGRGLGGRPRATRRSRSRILARLCFLALVILVRIWMVARVGERVDVTLMLEEAPAGR